jgi:hypothetical protein
MDRPDATDPMSPDTHPDAAAVQLAVLRRLGPQGRLRLAFELSALARTLLERNLRQQHPDWDAAALRDECIRRALAPAEPG